MTSAVGVAILVLAGIWLFGGLLARWPGALNLIVRNQSCSPGC
jgi:hypothetical protein